MDAARRQTPRTYERVRAVLLNHYQLQWWYLTGFYIFKSVYITQREQLNMLKLWAKSEKDIDNQRITFMCIGAL